MTYVWTLVLLVAPNELLCFDFFSDLCFSGMEFQKLYNAPTVVGYRTLATACCNLRLPTVNCQQRPKFTLISYRIVSLFFSVCLFNPRSKTNEPDDLILNLDLKPGGRNKKRKEKKIKSIN